VPASRPALRPFRRFTYHRGLPRVKSRDTCKRVAAQNALSRYSFFSFSAGWFPPLVLVGGRVYSKLSS
jgi:hypothetical protein